MYQMKNRNPVFFCIQFFETPDMIRQQSWQLQHQTGLFICSFIHLFYSSFSQSVHKIFLEKSWTNYTLI